MTRRTPRNRTSTWRPLFTRFCDWCHEPHRRWDPWVLLRISESHWGIVCPRCVKTAAEAWGAMEPVSMGQLESAARSADERREGE